jgi:uncharacterized membrane protein YdbT with pleckstrin-like domain
MSDMWERRLLSALIVVVLTAFASRLDLQGYAFFVMVAVVVPVAMLGGAAAAEWLQGRRHRAPS